MSASNITEFKNDTQRLIHQVITMDEQRQNNQKQRQICVQYTKLFKLILKRYAEVGHIESLTDDLEAVVERLNHEIPNITIVMPKVNIAAQFEIPLLQKAFPECEHGTWQQWVALGDKAEPKFQDEIVLYLTTWVGKLQQHALKNISSPEYHCRTIIVFRGFNAAVHMVHDCNDIDFGGQHGMFNMYE